MKNYLAYIIITTLGCLFFGAPVKSEPTTSYNSQLSNTHILQDFALAHCIAISFNWNSKHLYQDLKFQQH